MNYFVKSAVWTLLIFIGIFALKLLVHPFLGLLTIPILLIVYFNFISQHKEENPDSPMSSRDKLLLFSGGAAVYISTLLIGVIMIAMR